MVVPLTSIFASPPPCHTVSQRKKKSQVENQGERGKAGERRMKLNSLRSLSLNSIWPTETSSKLLAKCVIILGGETEGKGRKGEGSG